MDKIWLKNYPPGIAAGGDVNEFSSLKDVLEQSCRRFSALPAYSNMGSSMSYAQLDQSSRDFAAYLQSIGLKKGARVERGQPVGTVGTPLSRGVAWRASRRASTSSAS